MGEAVRNRPGVYASSSSVRSLGRLKKGQSPEKSQLGLREALSLRSEYDRRGENFTNEPSVEESRAARGGVAPTRTIPDSLFGGRIRCDYQSECGIAATFTRTAARRQGKPADANSHASRPTRTRTEPHRWAAQPPPQPPLTPLPQPYPALDVVIPFGKLWDVSRIMTMLKNIVVDKERAEENYLVTSHAHREADPWCAAGSVRFCSQTHPPLDPRIGKRAKRKRRPAVPLRAHKR